MSWNSSEFLDDTLGLVYYNYRHYEPITGRWLRNERGSKLAVVVFGVMIVLAMVLGLVAALKGLSMREMVGLGSDVVASKAVRHTVADRITAIEAKKPLLKQVAKSAGLGKGAIERMGRDKR